MAMIYMSHKEKVRSQTCKEHVSEGFQMLFVTDRTGAVPVVWVPQEQSLTSCTAVRGSVAAVYWRRDRILLVTWKTTNINEKPLTTFISGIDLIPRSYTKASTTSLYWPKIRFSIYIKLIYYILFILILLLLTILIYFI